MWSNHFELLSNTLATLKKVAQARNTDYLKEYLKKSLAVNFFIYIFSLAHRSLLVTADLS